MQNIINYSADTQTLTVLDKEQREAVAYISDADWSILCAKTYVQYSRLVQTTDVVEIGVIDVTSPNAIAAAEEFRKADPDAVLVIVSDMSISPVTYIKPSIMASALIIKPIESTGIARLRDAMRIKLIQSDSRRDTEQRFCMETKQGKHFFSYNKIVYFEAREKRVFLNTAQNEYAFYSTLDDLESELPSTFVRCHRGFIINSAKIERISFGEGLIYMNDGIVVPMSRNNKSKIKAFTEKQQAVLA